MKIIKFFKKFSIEIFSRIFLIVLGGVAWGRDGVYAVHLATAAAVFECVREMWDRSTRSLLIRKKVDESFVPFGAIAS